MICQLHYRMSSLPALCRDASKLGNDPVFQVWSQFASELEQQVSPDVTVCMDAAIATIPALPDTVAGLLRATSTSLGCFDLQGQIQSLEEAVTTCRNKLEQLRGRREVQIRNYQTLGLCTGAALVILFI